MKNLLKFYIQNINIEHFIRDKELKRHKKIAVDNAIYNASETSVKYLKSIEFGKLDWLVISPDFNPIENI